MGDFLDKDLYIRSRDISEADIERMIELCKVMPDPSERVPWYNQPWIGEKNLKILHELMKKRYDLR